MKKRSAGKSDENIMVVGKRSTKEAEEDPNTTVRLACANSAGSINETSISENEHGLPIFPTAQSQKGSCNSSDLFSLAAKYLSSSPFLRQFYTCFLQWCAVFHWNNLKQNWGCSMAVVIKNKVCEGSKIKNCSKNGNGNYFGYFCTPLAINWSIFATHNGRPNQQYKNI